MHKSGAHDISLNQLLAVHKYKENICQFSFILNTVYIDMIYFSRLKKNWTTTSLSRTFSRSTGGSR